MTEEDLKVIYEIQKKNYDMGDVRDRIPDWVSEQLEEDDYFFEDFNSTVFSDDEISEEEICRKILDDNALIETIADAYRALENQGYSSPDGFNWWESLNSAIEGCVSIGDIMGEILFEKHHRELEVGRWRVVILEKGDAYGLDGKLIYEKDEPAVEFYDTRYNQFTGARYALSSLLISDWSGLSLEDRAKQGIGLCLDLDVEEWTVGPGELNVIGSWLKAFEAKTQDRVEQLVSDVRSRTVQSPVREFEKEFELG